MQQQMSICPTPHYPLPSTHSRWGHTFFRKILKTSYSQGAVWGVALGLSARFFLAQPGFPETSVPGSWAVMTGENVAPQHWKEPARAVMSEGDQHSLLGLHWVLPEVLGNKGRIWKLPWHFSHLLLHFLHWLPSAGVERDPHLCWSSAVSINPPSAWFLPAAGKQLHYLLTVIAPAPNTLFDDNIDNDYNNKNKNLNTYWALIMCLTCINSLSPPKKPIRWSLLLPHFTDEEAEAQGS